MRRSKWPALVLVCLLAPVHAACGDDPSPGTITVTASGITGAQGKLWLTEARLAGRQAAIACVPIDADPFSATVVLEAIVGPTPCEDSAPIELAAGTYDILTAVMMGGAPAPDVCARGQVVVDGDAAITMPALTAAGCN